MNFKKKVNGSWTDIPHYIHKTSTDIITTLPAVLYPNDTTATVGLKGNMSQTGTPTPQNPVMPNGCGNMTKNLYPLDINKLHVGRVETDGTIDYEVGTLSIEGDTITYTYTTAWRGFYTDFISIGSATTLTMSPVPPNGTISCACYDSNNNFLGRANVVMMTNSRVFTLIEGTTKIRIAASSADNVFSVTKPQLEVGNVATAYEPYGVKIPISSASTTTPVYLGEVETTRKIGKYECTGEENWQFYSDTSGEYGAWQFYINGVINGMSRTSAYSNVTGYGVTSETRARYYYGVYLVTNGTGITFQMAGAKDTFTNITAWKTYLAAQYAAGTPVTVWYVLATEETGIVNEPLMKIGDYADEVSNVSIPVTAGGDTISVDTTLQPSEVTVNYKGWHPVQNVHERDNGAWT